MKYSCPPVFLFPKSDKICAIIPDSVKKIDRFPCSVVIGTPLKMSKLQ